MDLLYGIRISAEVCFVLSQFTRLTDRQTDRRTDGNAIDNTALRIVRSMQSGKNFTYTGTLKAALCGRRSRGRVAL